jgi:hypothetical protein
MYSVCDTVLGHWCSNLTREALEASACTVYAASSVNDTVLVMFAIS